MISNIGIFSVNKELKYSPLNFLTKFEVTMMIVCLCKRSLFNTFANLSPHRLILILTPLKEFNHVIKFAKTFKFKLLYKCRLLTLAIGFRSRGYLYFAPGWSPCFFVFPLLVPSPSATQSHLQRKIFINIFRSKLSFHMEAYRGSAYLNIVCQY